MHSFIGFGRFSVRQSGFQEMRANAAIEHNASANSMLRHISLETEIERERVRAEWAQFNAKQ